MNKQEKVRKSWEQRCIKSCEGINNPEAIPELVMIVRLMLPFLRVFGAPVTTDMAERTLSKLEEKS